MSTEFVSKIKQLRELTQAGLKDCRDALKECGSDILLAVEYLKVKGLFNATKKIHRHSPEGVIYSYIHPGSRIGVMLELNCETDFVAKNKTFLELAHNICAHIAAAKPKYIDRDSLDNDIISAQLDDLKGKSKEVIAEKLNKYFKSVCLMEQKFVKDESITVDELVRLNIAIFGENIKLKRFSMFIIGE